MTTIQTRKTVGLGALLGGIALCLAAGASLAQSYPSKPVRIISPYAPGGGNDVICRAVAVRLSPRLGQSVIVENKPGANTIIGADYVAKLPPDGYTIILLPTQHVYNPAIYDKMPYDPIKDFSPITMVGAAPLLLAAHAAAPFKNLKELIQYAKGRPANDLTFSTSGAGSAGHLAGALLGQVTGIQLQHVAYKGAAPAAQALLTHEVMMSFSPPSTLLPHIRSGKMIAIGMTSEKRSQAAPDVPTIAEQGLPDFDAGLWYGFMGPAKMPRDIVMKLNSSIGAVVTDKEMKEVLAKLGIDAFSSTPEQFAKVLETDLKRWAPVVKAAGMKPE
jgi:tripartite-type tricarboxylate transporter receptor subunit TctC